MSKLKTTKWDAADSIEDFEDAYLYLEATLEDTHGDRAAIMKALGNIARSKGMAEVAEKTGLRRETLYRMLSEEGNPTIDNFIKVLAAFGIEMRFAPSVRTRQRLDLSGQAAVA